jgi:hypothetical protein
MNQVVWILAINGKETNVDILDLGILGLWNFPLCGAQKYKFLFQHDMIFIVPKSSNIKKKCF